MCKKYWGYRSLLWGFRLMKKKGRVFEGSPRRCWSIVCRKAFCPLTSASQATYHWVSKTANFQMQGTQQLSKPPLHCSSLYTTQLVSYFASSSMLRSSNAPTMAQQASTPKYDTIHLMVLVFANVYLVMFSILVYLKITFIQKHYWYVQVNAHEIALFVPFVVVLIQ